MEVLIVSERISPMEVNIPPNGKEFILKNVEKIIDSRDAWTDNKFVNEFEAKFSAYVGSKYAIAVNNGLSALMACFFSLGLYNSESIAFVPTLTAPPTAIACAYCNMKVVFVDSSVDDLGMDVDDLKEKIKKYHQGKSVIVPVHISGIVSENIDKTILLGKEYDIPVVEDCAHAHGASYEGVCAGLRGDMGIFSFFMTKVLMSGEGGIIVTNDKIHDDTCKVIRNYGKVAGRYEHIGANWRMSELNAVVALWQTMDAERILDERTRIAEQYNSLLGNQGGLKLLTISPKQKSAYYKYVVYISKHINRDELKKTLNQKYSVTLSGAVYENPCHREPVFYKFKNFINLNDSFPQSDFIADQQICLPIYPGLDNTSVAYIANSLKESLNFL